MTPPPRFTLATKRHDDNAAIFVMFEYPLFHTRSVQNARCAMFQLFQSRSAPLFDTDERPLHATAPIATAPAAAQYAGTPHDVWFYLPMLVAALLIYVN